MQKKGGEDDRIWFLAHVVKSYCLGGSNWPAHTIHSIFTGANFIFDVNLSQVNKDEENLYGPKHPSQQPAFKTITHVKLSIKDSRMLLVIFEG